MADTKFQLLVFLAVGALFLLGVWAVLSLDSGKNFAERERLRSEKEMAELEAEKLRLEKEQEELGLPDRSGADVLVEEEKETEPVVSGPHPLQDLIDRLNQLVKDKIVMKDGSSGTRVGTVQEFLNIYHKTQSALDNDYGPTTKNRVIAFQKEQGLLADGQAGAGTFQKMIDWLKANR